MGSPLGSSDFETSASGAVTAGSSLSGMVGQTQDAVTAQLQSQVAASSGWNNASSNFFAIILGGFTSVVANVTAAINDFLASLCDAITGDTGGLIDLSSWATALRSDASSALSNTQTIASGISGSTSASSVAPTVSSMQSNITSTAAAVAALTATATSNGSGGASVSDTFGTVEALSADASYTVGGTSGTGMALTVTQAGEVILSGTPAAAGILYALSATQMQTDNHQTTLVCQAAGNAQACTTLIVRASANMSNFVYANIFGGSGTCYLGYGTFSGGTWTFNDWTSSSFTQSQGQTISLGAVGHTYTIYVNGTPGLAWSDTAGNAPTGASYRYVGFTMQMASYINWYLGWPVASFSAADTSSPAVVGTGWNLARVATSSVALPGSGWQPFGTATLDTQEQANGVTVVTLGTGTVQIVTAGWYMVSVSAYYSSDATQGDCFQVGVYHVTGGIATLALSGSQVEGNQVYQAQSAGVIYCAVGDELYPAIYQAGSNNIVGTATGAITYFVGALCSGAAG